MKSTASPRVLYCGPEDGYFKKLARHADGFQMEARGVQFTGSPQKTARSRRASVLLLKIRNEFDPKQQEWLARSDASVPVIVLCQNGRLETAVHALQYKIFDYFCTEQSPDVVLQRITEALDWKSSHPWKKPMSAPAGLLHGINPEIRKINEEARALARETSKPVILCGEAGTGKEHLAYGMYRISADRGLPFIRYDCRLIQQISRFDGAPVSRFVLTGLQELKKRHHGGVLFLQHLDLIQPDQQTDIIEAGRGSSIRLIASCQTARSSTGTEGAVPSLRIPALRQHPEDIPALAEHFISQTARGRKLRSKSVSQEAIALMQEYAWPGNIQELANVIERMMLIEPSNMINSGSWRASHGYGFRWTLEGASHFSTLIEEVLKNSEDTLEDGALYDQFMARMKKLLVDLVLPRVDYNQAMAAKVLGISRNTLREILRQG